MFPHEGNYLQFDGAAADSLCYIRGRQIKLTSGRVCSNTAAPPPRQGSIDCKRAKMPKTGGWLTDDPAGDSTGHFIMVDVYFQPSTYGPLEFQQHQGQSHRW